MELIDENLSFDHILIHHKVNLDINHSEKKLEDIANIIDKEIEKRYYKIDKMIQTEKGNVEIDENFQKACQLLFQKWFKKYEDKIQLFEFTKSHLVDISVKILFDENVKQILEELLIDDPLSLIDILKKKHSNEFPPNQLPDESSIEDKDKSLSFSFNTNLDNLSNQANQNNLNINLINNINNNSINNNNKNDHKNQQRNKYRNDGNSGQNRYEVQIRKFCMAQAYVYEKLVDSHLFQEINWKNKLPENENGELIILPNNHKYNVKKSFSNYDFIIKNKNNESYKISVKIGKFSKNYMKFNFKYSQWSSLNTELKSIVFAFVSLKSENNPQIYFTKNILLNEL